MDTRTMRRRVEQARVGRLTTITPDGRPHVVPCCFVLSGSVLYSAVDSKPKSSHVLQRVRNLRALPSAALLVDHYTEDWSRLWWIRIDGTGRILESGSERARANELLGLKYEQYLRMAPLGPAIAIDVTGWRAWP